MALEAAVTMDGGVSIPTAYIRVTGASIFSSGNGEDKEWKIVYDVEVYRDADARAVNLKCPCGAFQHFKTDYDLATTDGPITLAYADLKGRLSEPKDC